MRGAAPAPASVEPSEPFGRPVRGRFNARFFAAFDRYINHVARPAKSVAFAGVVGGRVLEIGAGVGANLGYLPPGTELVALEPNLRMHDRLRARCAAAGIDLTILAARAERIPLPDASVDEVVCSLVLCTVEDPGAVVTEVRRVLRPGGRFRFVEHVAAPGGLRRRCQRALRSPWGWLFEGCDLCRDTGALLQGAGFADLELHTHLLRRSVFYPVNHAIAGIAWN